jgi:hypothetical protein
MDKKGFSLKNPDTGMRIDCHDGDFWLGEQIVLMPEDEKQCLIAACEEFRAFGKRYKTAKLGTKLAVPEDMKKRFVGAVERLFWLGDRQNSLFQKGYN